MPATAAALAPEPTPDGARHRGREAFYAGVMRDRCPFPSGSALADQWRAGWDHAAAVRLRLEALLANEG